MDTTKRVVEILTDALEGVPVSTEMPWQADSTRPDRYVTVDLAGDRSTPFLLRPRYALTVWGRTDMDAHSMALACVDALRGASEEDDYLSACQLETMSRDEWARNGQARYMVAVDLTFNTDEE